MTTDHLYISALLCLGLFSAGETLYLISVKYSGIVAHVCLPAITFTPISYTQRCGCAHCNRYIIYTTEQKSKF